MSIPCPSGPISMSMINTALGRTSNTANTSLAGGTTPAVGSQFWLGGQSGSLNQTAPHAMSEWFCYTVSTSTTTTTTTAAQTCTDYFNNTSTTFFVSYVPCGGSESIGAFVGPNDSICAVDGTCGGDCGFLSILGSC